MMARSAPGQDTQLPKPPRYHYGHSMKGSRLVLLHYRKARTKARKFKGIPNRSSSFGGPVQARIVV